ncbi:MAG: hypothetical protein HRU75_06620 [Planctomycetia bacterium]|nr:MAG: hypothetical protein HRU75_06620 [Planctomycetia bacterium]
MIRSRRLCMLALPLLLLSAPAHAWLTRVDGPVNGGFENGEQGGPPTGWVIPTTGTTVELVREGAEQGERFARLRFDGSGQIGNLMQSFDATPFRAKKVALRASVRIKEGADNGGHVWMRVDRRDDKRGFFDNMGGRPIKSRSWTQIEIKGDVADDALTINVGAFLTSAGVLDIDDLRLEIVSDAAVVTREAARPLEGRAEENLRALARLVGYVRHFHPSDAAAAADWDAFTISAVRRVESAQSAQELADRLNELFTPIAPTVQVFPTGTTEPTIHPAVRTAPGTKSQFIREYRHVGCGQKTAGQSIYSSRRVRHELPPDEAVPVEHDPAQGLWRAEIGGGLTCIVPLRLWADERGTLPVSEHKPGESAPGGGFTADDRATRLAAVILGWNVMQHFYPYFDVVRCDWHATLGESLRSAANAADECAFYDVLQRMTADLHDGHVWVSHTCGGNNALPPITTRWVEGRLVVTQVASAEGAPVADGAENLVRPGDAIVSIDGVDTKAAMERTESLISGAPQWRRWRAQSEVLRGRFDTPLTLELENLEGQVRTVTLSRSGGGMASATLPEIRPEPIAELREGILYIDVERATDKEFAALGERLNTAKGIIVDVRGYPRSNVFATLLQRLAPSVLRSPQWHVPTPARPDRIGLTFQQSGWPVQPLAPRLTARVAFLTDGRAISAAETFMAIVAHYKLGEIIGAPTAGTNGNVNSTMLPGGFAFSWTGMKVLDHNGGVHHGVGVLPTIPMTPTRRGVAEGRDELLEKAIDVVSK